jgi:hypothetical protein
MRSGQPMVHLMHYGHESRLFHSNRSAVVGKEPIMTRQGYLGDTAKLCVLGMMMKDRRGIEARRGSERLHQAGTCEAEHA